MVSMDIHVITICIQFLIGFSLGWWHAGMGELEMENTTDIRGIFAHLTRMLTTRLILFLQNMYTGPRVTTQRREPPLDPLIQAVLTTDDTNEPGLAGPIINIGMANAFCPYIDHNLPTIYPYSLRCHVLQYIWTSHRVSSRANRIDRGTGVRVHIIRTKNYRCWSFRAVGRIYSIPHTKNSRWIITQSSCYYSYQMLTHTITYPPNRSLAEIRGAHSREIRNTSELQMYLPSKIDGRNMTTKQYVQMIDQVIEHVGVNISVADKTRLTTGLGSTGNGYVSPSINGGFSTKNCAHIRTRISPVAVSPNGMIPNTIPYIIRVPVHVTTTATEVGAPGGVGQAGSKDTDTIISMMSQSKDKSKGRHKEDTKMLEARKKQATANNLARLGKSESSPVKYTVLVIAGPSVLHSDHSIGSRTVLSSYDHTAKHYIAWLVGYNKAMLPALGDVLDMTKTEFENLLQQMLRGERDLWEDICSRLYYQYEELRNGSETAESIYVAYLSHNEADEVTQKRVAYLTNILSSYYHGDQVVYKKGLKFLIRKYVKNPREKKSVVIAKARKMVVQVTVAAPFTITIQGLLVTPIAAMERIVTLLSATPTLTTCYLEYIGPLTDNDGIYVSFTDRTVASQFYFIVLAHPLALKELFDSLYTVERLFATEGRYEPDTLAGHYDLFFCRHGGDLPRKQTKTIIRPHQNKSYSEATMGKEHKQVEDMEMEPPVHIQTQDQSQASSILSQTEKRKYDAAAVASSISSLSGLTTNSGGMTSQSQSEEQHTIKRFFTGASQTQSPSSQVTPATLPPAPPSLLDFCIQNEEWTQGPNLMFTHSTNNIALHLNGELEIELNNLTIIEPRTKFPNDCAIWSMMNLLKFELNIVNPFDWRYQELIHEDLRLLMMQKDKMQLFSDSQKNHFTNLIRQYVQCMNSFLDDEIEGPTIQESLHGETIINYTGVDFILIQQPGGTARLIPTHPNVRFRHLADMAYIRNGYTLLFSQNHVQLVDLSHIGKLFEQIKDTINQNEWYSTLDSQHERLHHCHQMRFGSTSGQPDPTGTSPERQVITPPLVTQLADSTDDAASTPERDLVTPIASAIEPEQMLDMTPIETTLQGEADWKRVDNIYVHFRYGLKLVLRPLHFQGDMRVLINGPLFLPEVTTLPHDCAFWHMRQFFKFRGGLRLQDWIPTTLTVTDLDQLVSIWEQLAY